MNVMMVRAKVSEENVPEVEAAARAMFSSIERAKPQGVGTLPGGSPTASAS